MTAKNPLSSESCDLSSQRQTDLSRVSLFEFQEPLNCSNLTSVAYALSALGFAISVDEVIYKSLTPLKDVTDMGMRCLWVRERGMYCSGVVVVVAKYLIGNCAA